MGGDLPDLVRDTELLADFHQDNVTIHKKRWNHAKREIWYRQRILGHGGYGLVWLEQELDRKGKPKDKSFRAVKQIRSTKPGSNLADFVRELEAVAKFSQEKYQDFFVKSHGWYESPEALHIAMEYCPFGDLQKYTASRGSLPEEEAKVVMRQVFRGLAHMHEEKFAHRDLKPAVCSPWPPAPHKFAVSFMLTSS
ncbi:protein kinase domain-containing protein [Micromonospora sp. XM-20-01]|uniref:protein kinase domain-containing protein n=1 Tax=Micromonospora sp. XM-20-01 TaxID=2583240 RepID=UPI00112BFC2C